MRLTRKMHVQRPTTNIALALCLALSTAPLAACAGAQTSGDASNDTSAPATTEQHVAMDPSSWKTLGDAFAARTETMASGWNDDYYVSMFKVGDSIARVVAKIDPDAQAKLDAVDWSSDDVAEKNEAAVSALAIQSAEDVTSELVSQEELDKLVGKTGRQLVEEGWTFSSYAMYGGAQTAAAFDKGYLSYSFTFDAITPEDAIEDGGASIMDAAVVSAEFYGPAESGTDPAQVK